MLVILMSQEKMGLLGMYQCTRLHWEDDGEGNCSVGRSPVGSLKWIAPEPSNVLLSWAYMGGCQNYGPFSGP